MSATEPVVEVEGIAVVGLAGRFPGAPDVGTFWRNLVAGADSITRFSDEELAAAGYDPAALRTDPGFVPARGVIDRPEWFDAAFFGIQPKEAEAIDPQQRVFMETAWHALEDAGCDPTSFDGLISVFAGMSNNTYGKFVRARRDLVEAVGELTAMLGNEKDYLATRLAYKLNLRGPALTVATACSTSLVAITEACQNLVSYGSDIALAGGVSISFPQTRGYFFREGGMTSPDGQCRPFDAQAAGAVFSHGCGVVVLKRLGDALAAGDQIYAVVKGWALNNDGAGKVSITAPSVDGQAEVIALAQALAGASPESIGYLEAHGTGTPMGDPIEVTALTQAFGGDSGPRHSCALGSLKSNIGHLDAASGVAGFIKTVLALRHAQIPATLHLEKPNPELQLSESPFYIPTETTDWPVANTPRRAGVSSFGVGGTNAHAVLEQAPTRAESAPGRPAQILPLSARTATALDQAAENLALHLERNPEHSLADVAFTLQTGRQQFAHRRAIVATTTADAITALRTAPRHARHDDRRDTPVAFLFPGQGSQYPRMGAQLYASEPTFRDAFDAIADLLQPELDLDLRTTIFRGDIVALRQTRLTQPALFTIEYALAQMWLSFGVQPDAFLGHSVGEYVAATLAGVFSLEDAARLVAARARLVQDQPGGTMLAVRLGEEEAQEFVSEDTSIAAINSRRLCVLSGRNEAIAVIEEQLATREVPARRLITSHAFHSAMIEPVVAPFSELVRRVKLHAPRIPFLSNVTGDWITDAQATDPAYWAGHVRAAVRFSDGLGKLLEGSGRTLLEVGPGNALSQLARQHSGKTAAHEFAHTLLEDTDEPTTLATAQGRLWLAGVPLDWSRIHAGENRRRISLPGYPFERQRYFADLPAGTPTPLTALAQDGEPLIVTTQAGAAPATPVIAIGDLLPATTPTPTEAGSAEPMLQRLKTLITEHSGTDLSAADESTTLLDLGFDSLFLSQLIIALQKRFGVRLSLIDLFVELDSLGALAEHLEKVAPVKAATGTPATPAEVSAPLIGHALSGPVQDGPGTPPTIQQQRWLDDLLAHWENRPSFLSTTHSDADIGRVVTTFEKSIAEMVDAGFSMRREVSTTSQLPTIEAQRELWFLCQSGPLANAALNETCTVHYVGEFNPTAMQRAVQILVDRHEALRTVFSEDGALQIVRPALAVEVPLIDLSKLPEDERATRRAALQTAEGLRAFDLARGPLIALQILKLGESSHDLLITAHHIVCDGWSYDIVLRELGKIYTALVEDQPHGLPTPMQMREYQKWEIEQQRSSAFAADQAFWLERFRTLPPPLDLPGDRPRPPQRTHGGAREVETLSAELFHEVTQTATRLQSTPFVLLLSAFKTLLFRLSGEPDLVVGVPSAGQNLAGGTNLIGHCVNLLALRSTLDETEAFTAFLKTTRTNLFAAVEHQRFNFGQLVRELPLPRDPSRVPLISSTFNLDPPLSDIHYGMLRHEFTLNPRAAYQFDLSFNCVGHEGALAVHCDYNTDLFDPATIRRWLGYFRNLLTAIVAAPETPLSRLPLITPAERAELIDLGRGPANEYPSEVPLAELFQCRSAAQPGAIAVIDGTQRHTYRELDERANQVAHHLISVGLQAGQFVGLRSERSARFLWEAIGVLRAGGAYLPVSPEEPAERMKIIRETCAVLLFDPEAYASGSTAPVEQAVDAGGPAYLLYTSGSTGIPKGVVVPHRAVTRLVWNTNYVRFQADDVVAFVSNLNFDAATFEIWGALLHGGTLVVTPTEVALSTVALRTHLEHHGVTILFLTTSLFNRTAQAAPDIFRRLRYVVFGGEAANAESVRLVLERGKPEHLVNGYGPTEATTFAICHEVERLTNAFVPIGRSIANTDAFLLDSHREPVPRGVAGEIYLGGPGLALGYHQDPQLTKERFIHTEFGRLYRTGDLARWQADGTIEYLGRRDQQVKLRGFRIEPGEIETALKQLPEMQDAAVVLRDVQGDAQLVAYCVRRKSEAVQLDPAVALREKLPKFMIPSAFVYLDHLPLTPNGKLDRAALPAPTETASLLDEVVPPSNSLESQMIEIWEEVLKRHPIGVRHDFFAIGGHSLLAAQVISLIHQRLGYQLPFAEFFARPTIENHARTLLRKEVAVHHEPYALINPRGSLNPVFFLHGDFIGGGFFCTTLAHEIGEDRPFYAIHPHGLQGEVVPETIEAMAADRVRLVRQIQPHGPYIVGGYCNGALTSWHVARLLREAGEEVSALLMLYADGSNMRFRWLRRLAGVHSALRAEDETASRHRFVEMRRRFRDREDMALYYLRAAGDLAKQPPTYQWQRLWRKLGRLARRVQQPGNPAATSQREDPVAAAFPARSIGDGYSDACSAFIPGPYDGPMTLLWPREEPYPSSRGPASGWEKLCRQITIEHVPGHHHSCISQNAHVREVGAVMRKVIAKAESELAGKTP